ncbi:MAG: ribosome small subunit-dependent GTPase A [Gammaproteobacteria bacterium]|nr:ribosome small subunit-dependent GTPase A [Gammaproteobacteria bacterium]
MVAKVIANFGHNIAIRTEKGELINCLNLKRLGLLVCGDLVEYSRQSDGSVIIQSVLPRKSELSRPDKRGQLKPLAANLHQLVVVIAPVPAPDWLMVSSYLLYAQHHGLHTSIILNKSDLLEKTGLEDLKRYLQTYQSLGVPVVIASCKLPDTTGKISQLFSNRTSVLVGQSGVGKSSIVQTLLPDQQIQIKTISAITGLGSHTTTTTMLYQLEGGGELIDSPGVRQFSIEYFEPEVLQQNFLEFNSYRQHCQFKNCTHLHEPGCAVRLAVEQGEITRLRWSHYCELMQRCK